MDNRYIGGTEFELPNGWTLARIPELVDSDGVFVDGDWVETKDQDPQGDVRLIQLADLGDGRYRDKSNRYLTGKKARELGCTFLKPNDVLIARMPDPLGRACIFPGDAKPCVTVVDVCVVRTGTYAIDQRWLVNAINAPSFRAAIAAMQSGSTRKRISRGNLAKLRLPIPPLAEQHRIVAKIEQLFSDIEAGVAALQKTKALLKRYRQAVLKAAVEGRLTAEWRAADGGKVEPASVLLERIRAERAKNANRETKPLPPVDTTELGELPKGWCWAELKEISEAVGGYAFSSKDYSDAGFQVLKIGNIKMQKLNLEEKPVFVRCSDAVLLEKYLLRRNDIVITLTGTRRKRDYGFVAMVKTQKNLLLNQRVARLRFDSALDADYFLVALQSELFRDQFFKYETGIVGQGNATKQAITDVAVPVPPALEQHQIAVEVERRLSVADEVERTVDAALARAERLRQSILKRAFAGKLLPQDPNDEPARKLLERIAEGRGTAFPKRPRSARPGGIGPRG